MSIIVNFFYLIYFGLLIRATRCRVSKTKLDLLKDNGDNYIQQLESISLYPKIIINYRKLFKISKVMFKDNSCQLNRQLTSIQGILMSPTDLTDKHG